MSRTSDRAAGAQRLERIPPYLFAEIDRKVQQKRNEGVDVISLDEMHRRFIAGVHSADRSRRAALARPAARPR